MPRLKTDFDDFYVEEIQDINYCGEVTSSFSIRIARYNLFGRKRYIRFYDVTWGMGDYHKVRVYKNTKDEILEEYKKFLKTHFVSQKLVKHEVSPKEICN